jgi:kynureninase
MIPVEHARALDANDVLSHKRAEFILPTGTIYMDGNSLGPLTTRAKRRVAKVVSDEWGEDLIQSWNKHKWIDLPITVGEKIALLIGADEGQVICCDSISVNLFKLLASALTLNAERQVVLSQHDNFPTDLYMAEGLADLLGEQRCQLKQVDSVDLIDSIDESVAVLMLTQTNFRSGELHDMQQLTDLAQSKGVLVIWDLAHSVGAFPVELDKCNVDFAVGCGYKYLNGGPGSPAFVYVASRHQSAVKQPLSGWMGHKSPFDFDPAYAPADGVSQYLSGTPNILSLVALDAALDVFYDVDMRLVQEKSQALSNLFLELLRASPALTLFNCISPSVASKRGSQLAFTHPEAFAISQALIAHGVVVDFRAPNIVRFGFMPLYTSFENVWSVARILNDIFEQKLYDLPEFRKRSKVT